MAQSVESFCNAVAKCGLLTGDSVRAMRQRWVRECPHAKDDLSRFLRWAAENQFFTEYQAGFVSRGNGQQLFIGPYVVLERIGKGRMAGVYRARHGVGQEVALKVLPPSKAKDPQVLGRFQRESRLALRLDHPNVVRTFQTGVQGNLYYLVMEHLEGETLEEVLQRRRRLPSPEAVRLVCQALQGLQHIHELDMVHRDLKPGNLMLVAGQPETTTTATVKILDIGLGRALFDEGTPGAAGQHDLTGAADVLGTPAYMAPEQARDAHAADIRADIYSLGCVLYHALAGQPPFPDVNAVRLMVRHATETPRPVRELAAQVPDALQHALDGMLAKDPAQRFATPRDAADVLRAFEGRGATVIRAQGASLSEYLRWLKNDGSPATIPPTIGPGRKSGGSAPPRQAPAGPAPAPPPPPPAAAPKPAAPAPVRHVPAKLVVDVLEEIQDVAPAASMARAAPAPAEQPATAEPQGALSTRDLLMLAVGIGGVAALLLIVLIVWLVLRT